MSKSEASRSKNETKDQIPAPRIPLKLDIEFRRSYARSSEKGSLRNISLSGAFLEHSDKEIVTGERVQMTFKVGGRIRKIQAQVVWCNGKGSGIRFMPLSNRDVQIVDDLMYFVESKRDRRRSVLFDIFENAA